MKIADLFRNQGIDQSSVQKNNQAQKASEQEAAARSVASKAAGEDSISISPLARQLASIHKVANEDEALQQQRVEEIKQRVNSGNYNVSSNELASSLIAFAQEE